MLRACPHNEQLGLSKRPAAWRRSDGQISSATSATRRDWCKGVQLSETFEVARRRRGSIHGTESGPRGRKRSAPATVRRSNQSAVSLWANSFTERGHTVRKSSTVPSAMRTEPGRTDVHPIRAHEAAATVSGSAARRQEKRGATTAANEPDHNRRSQCGGSHASQKADARATMGATVRLKAGSMAAQLPRQRAKSSVAERPRG